MKTAIYKPLKTVSIAVATSLAIASMSASAFAASNADECATEISAAEQMMLTAKITNDQLTSIDAELQAANQLCGSGDFAGATAKIEASVETMKAAGN